MALRIPCDGRPLRLAYFAPECFGGLADYAREQARALAATGARVFFITPPSVAKAHQNAEYELVPILAEVPSPTASRHRWIRRMRSMGWILGNMQRLAEWIRREKVEYVLLGSYMEYFAPIWAPQFQRLARNGVVFGSVIHDPVRQTRIGPHWWHRRSIGAAYSFLAEAFVHDPIALDTVYPVAGLQTTVIPHGPYAFAPAVLPRETIRQQLQIPENGVLLLAFGHLRDAKNLDLVLRAMTAHSNVYLLVAGKELSATQRPGTYYHDLADQLNVADRCRWRIGFVPESEIGNCFEASDLVLLTYNGRFRSASGVLNVAVQYQKPCLASGGDGNLKTSVAKYSLGLWIEPDNVAALSRGLADWHQLSARPDWVGYQRENSWQRNATLMLQRFCSHSAGNGRHIRMRMEAA